MMILRTLFAMALAGAAGPAIAQPAPANPNIMSPPLSPATPGGAAGPTDTGRPPVAAATVDPAVGAAGVPPRSGIGKRLRRPR